MSTCLKWQCVTERLRMGRPQFELNYPPNVLCDHNLHKLKRSALYAVCAIVLTLCQSDDWPVATSKQQMTLQPWGSTVGPLVLDLFVDIALTDLSGPYCCCCNNTLKCGGEWPRIRRNSKIVSKKPFRSDRASTVHQHGPRHVHNDLM